MLAVEVWEKPLFISRLLISLSQLSGEVTLNWLMLSTKKLAKFGF